MVAVVFAGPTPLSAFLRPRSTGKGNKEQPPPRPGAKENVLGVFRRDLEFLRTRFRPLAKALDDLFWLRNLEDRRAGAVPTPAPSPPPWPKISPYPPGLSSLELMMADFEAVKIYGDYLNLMIKLWSMPLPERYDPEAVAIYFSCRPHVLAFRVIQVLLSFASASIKMQTSRSVRLSRYGNKRNEDFDSSKYQIGQIVKESLLKLGPTFVKVGQSLSTRPDIIGSEISKALSDLHDKVPPFPRAEAMKIIEEELECPVENVFGYISEEPIAAASFGQVYYGQTIDGSSVAIKIQRPNLLHTVVRDIYILRLGLALLRTVARRKNDLSLYADELGKGLVDELDYTIEAANASDFLEAHSKYPFISVPKVFRELTRKRVLTMEWMTGQNPNNMLLISQGVFQENNQHTEQQKSEAKVHLLDLVNKGVEATLVQLLETGLLHADPHAGNLRYTPEGRIGFLDFGLLCRMKRKHQLAMLASIVHIVNGDWKELVRDLTEMDVVTPGTNLGYVTMDLEDALGEVVFVNGFPDIKFSRVLGKIWLVALKYNFRMPPYFTLVLRSLASFEGLAVAADPNFKTFRSAYPYVVNKLLFDNSAATRRILYSVVFNKRRELQWQKILLFLRLGSMRKNSIAPRMLGSLSSIVHEQGENKETIETTSITVLKLLTSSHGVVLRRLLMTADANALARVLISTDAAFLRQKISMVLADIIFHWLSKANRRNHSSAGFYHHSGGQNMRELNLLSGTSFTVYQTALQDRRLRVIFYKVLNDIRRDSLLMLQLCWSSFTVFVSATALAIHHCLVVWSEAYLAPLVPRKLAVSMQ